MEIRKVTRSQAVSYSCSEHGTDNKTNHHHSKADDPCKEWTWNSITIPEIWDSKKHPVLLKNVIFLGKGCIRLKVMSNLPNCCHCNHWPPHTIPKASWTKSGKMFFIPICVLFCKVNNYFKKGWNSKCAFVIVTYYIE